MINDALSGDLNLFDESRGRRDLFAMPSHAFDVELDGFADQLPGLLQSGAGCDTAGKIGNVGAVARWGLREKYGVSAHFRPACLSIDAQVLGTNAAPLLPSNSRYFSAVLSEIFIEHSDEPRRRGKTALRFFNGLVENSVETTPGFRTTSICVKTS